MNFISLFFLGFFSFTPIYAALQPKQAPSGLFGYADEKGKFIIEPVFEKALPFENKVARVVQKNRWGVIDEKGKFIFKPQFADIQNFNNGTAIVANELTGGGNWMYGLLENTGKILFSPQYQYMTADYQHQLFIAGNRLDAQNVRFGVINRKNTAVIPLRFKEIRHTRYRTFAGKDDKNEWYFFDTEGKNVFRSKTQVISDFDENLAFVKTSSGWGIMLPNGKFATDTVFQKIKTISANRFDLFAFPQTQVIDNQNKTIFKTRLADITYLGENLFRFSEDGKSGLLDLKGKQIPKIAFDEINHFKNGLAVVKNAGLYGVLNTKGKTIFPAKYNLIAIDSISGLVLLQQSKRWQVGDRTGKVLTEIPYEEIRLQPYGMMIVRRGKQWFLLDRQGKPAGAIAYQNIQNFENQHAIARLQNLAGVIDTKAKWLIEPIYDSIRLINSHLAVGFSEKKSVLLSILSKKIAYKIEKIESFSGENFYKVTVSGKKGIISKTGQNVIATEYDELQIFGKDSICTVWQGDKKGLISLKGTTVFPLTIGFEDMQTLQEERIAVKINGKWGFIDLNAGLRIAHRYEAVQPFSEGLAAFKLKSKWGFLNLKEEIVIQPQFEAVCDFEKNRACVRKSGKWGFIDKNGKLLLPTQFDKLTLLPSCKFISEINGKKGLISPEGREMLHPSSEEIRELPNGNLLIKRNGKIGLLNAKGNETIPVMYDLLTLAGNYCLVSVQPPPMSITLK
ncbi:MAG: WG repeat-containing protein [Verrucomicrobia bacterium]|nr:WG repeat-containing protein [Cytophagales bacterium]